MPVPSDAEIKRAFDVLSQSQLRGRTRRSVKRAMARANHAEEIHSLSGTVNARRPVRETSPEVGDDASSEPTWSGVVIHPDIFAADPMHSPGTLADHLDLCIVDFEPDGSVSPSSFNDLLGDSGGICFTNVYDRDVRIDDWYYSFYHIPTAPITVPNPIADIVKPNEHPPINGPVLVVLNGPEDGMWEVTERIKADGVARTVWWYHRSGNVVADVFGQRELRRYLRTVV